MPRGGEAGFVAMVTFSAGRPNFFPKCAVMKPSDSSLATALDGGHSADRDAEKFRGLLLGLEIIGGFMAAFVIPFFANHPRLFLTEKDIRGED